MGYQVPFTCDSTKDISLPPLDDSKLLNQSGFRHHFFAATVSLSPHGCETVFLETFLNTEMSRDFPVIVQDFIRHECDNISLYIQNAPPVSYSDFPSASLWLKQKLFHLMYAALQQKSSYAVSLFQNLYKTYYSAEYQQLKHFPSISCEDLFSLSKTPVDREYAAATARILTACRFFSIELNPDCAAAYAALNKYIERMSEIQEKKGYTAPGTPFSEEADTFDSLINSFLSVSPSGIPESCRFRPDKLPKPSKSPPAKEVLIFQSAGNEKPDPEQEKLRHKTAMLSSRLAEKEQENRHLRSRCTETRRALSKAENALRQYESDRQELIALRNHVYHLTEKDVPALPKDIEAMSRAVSDKRIIIIGGHSNWTYKLRNRFPSWSFLSPKTSGSTDNRLLHHADYVYFFTSVIKHCTYMRFIHIVREHHIPFGYIHNTNIQSNIQQIYQDLCTGRHS